jgi:hypothetical protein
LTIFCPPKVGDFGAENPVDMLVMVLPDCKKKLGFDSYENNTLSFVEAVAGRLGGVIVIVAVRHTDP